MTIDVCAADQDCRARIAWHRGIEPMDNKYVFETVQVRGNRDYIGAWVGILDQSDGHNDLGQLFSASFNSPIDPIGETYTITALFDKSNAATVTVEGQGTTTFKFEDKLKTHIEIFKAIGIRVGGGDDVTDGEFVAYFDNVEIKTKGSCDNKRPKAKVITPKKNLPLDACSVDITFNEPMNPCCWDVEPDPIWGGIDTTSWSDDRKTFSIFRDTCDTPLPANTILEFIVNPNGTGGAAYFIDLVDLPAKTSKVKTKTVK